LCCENLSRIIDPLRSRCLPVRVPAPSVEDITAILKRVAQSERIQLPDPFAVRIAETCDRNARKSLLCLEASRNQHYPFKDDQKVDIPDWELYVNSIASMMIREQNPQA
jgi:replication factor C subunit 3/5